MPFKALNNREKKEKDSFLLNSHKTKRSQSALEYMMTYGWAILIIVIVAVILYSMGIFNPSSSISSTITGFQQTPISSAICTPTGVLVVSIEDATGNLINITSVNATANGKTAITTPNQLINPGNSARVLILGGCSNVSNTHFSSQITINYKEPGQPLSGPYVSTGSITGTSASFSQNTVANMTNQSYIAIPNSTTMYKIWHGGNQYTLVFWANFKKVYSPCTTFQTPNSNACYGSIQETQGCVSGLDHYPLNSTDYSVFLGQWNGTGGCSAGALSVNSPTLYAQYNKWEMVTGTLKMLGPNDGTLTICVNSTCSSGGFSYNPNTYTNAYTLIMGTYQVNGQVANVQLYDTALSSTQIKTLYEEGYAGIPVTTNGLVAWLPLDGNANDYSGNNNNGVPTNVNWVSP